ncbi:MAG TPA: hypothetical protein VFH48_14670 [Chloroflexota bacterium]|nr:hypothetical protein [Chloroflexota bacterium]
MLQESVRHLKLAVSAAQPEHRAVTAHSLAMALMNYGIALDRLQQPADAVDLYVEAERLLAEHASPGDADSELMRATLAVNRGLALILLERHDEAIVAFNAAIHARRVLIAAGRIELEADLASALVGRGDFRLGPDTLPYLEEAIGIYRRIADDNRPDLQEHLANALLNLGLYHWEQANVGDALRAFNDSIRFSDGLARQDRRTQVPIFLRALRLRFELLAAVAEWESAAADLTTICQVVAHFTRRDDDDNLLIIEWKHALRSVGRMHDDTRIQLLAELHPAIRNAIMTASADLSSDSHESGLE